MHFRCQQQQQQQQQQNAMTIHHSIATARQKELRSGVNVNQDRGNEFLASGGIVNVYFTSDVDAKDRIRSLNEFDMINLNEIRRTTVYDFRALI